MEELNKAFEVFKNQYSILTRKHIEQQRKSLDIEVLSSWDIEEDYSIEEIVSMYNIKYFGRFQ